MTESSRAIFLSYASQDGPAAQKICEALRAAGMEVWIDQSELRGGDVWDRKIREQIHDCRLFIPVISANSEHRDEGYFRREWSLAVDRTLDMAHKRAFLVPVVIDATTERGASVPEKFHELHWTRLPNGDTPPDFVEYIRHLLSPQPSASAASATTQSGAVGATTTSLQPSEVQKELFAKFSSPEELKDFLNSDAGKLLLRDTTPPPRPFHEQVGITIAWGVLLLCVGAALLIMRSAIHLPGGVAVGALVTAVGAAFVINALLRVWLTRKL